MKKNGAGSVFKTELLSKKLLRIMKLTMLLLTVFCLHVSAHTYSQEKISLKLKTVELKKVLQAIEKSSDYRFLFDEVLVKGKPKVSVDVE
jgi:type II secretory pathway component GspD/PulD (secretin)